MPEGTFSISQLLLTGAASLASAWLASKLTLRTALHQKVWEKKEAAYTRIIEALYEVKRYYDVRSDWSLLKHMQPDDEVITKGRAKGWMVVERSIDTGGWHFSPQVAGRLRLLMDHMGRGDRAGSSAEPKDHLECAFLISDAISEIVALAQEDLGVKRRGPFFSRLIDRLTDGGEPTK